MEVIKIVIPYIISITTLLLMWMLGLKKKSAWIIGIINQLLWLTYIIITETYGLLLMCISLLILYIINLYKRYKKYD